MLYPKLLVTTGKGKENQAIVEILDILFECDQEAYGIKTNFDGVVLIYTKLDPFKALSIIRKNPTSVVFKVVPLERCVKTSLNNIVNTGLELAKKRIKKNNTFIVDCIRRGRYVESSVVVERTLGARIIKELGAKVSFKNPEYIVRVEVLGEIACISVVKRGDIVRRKGRA